MYLIVIKKVLIFGMILFSNSKKLEPTLLANYASLDFCTIFPTFLIISGTFEKRIERKAKGTRRKISTGKVLSETIIQKVI